MNLRHSFNFLLRHILSCRTDFYKPLLTHLQNQCWMTEITQCTIQFLIRKKLPYTRNPILWVPKEGGHVIYEEIHFFPDCLYLSQLGFLITSYSPWPNRNWILSALISQHSDAFTLFPDEHKGESSEQRAPCPHIFLVCSLQVLCNLEPEKFLGEWQQKRVQKVRLPSGRKKVELCREENSATHRKVFAEL